METKVCNKCGIEKPIDEFELRADTKKYRNTCKICRKEYSSKWHKDNIEHIKEYNEKNKEHIKERSKKYYQEHKEHLKKYSKDFRDSHSEHYKDYNKKYKEEHKNEISEYNKKYNLLNNETINKHKKEYHKNNREYENEYAKKRHAIKKLTDTKYTLRIRMRNLIKHSFERKGYSKRSHTYKIIGTDYETFYNHLLKTFKKNYGYEWDGIEAVHIDHIIPLSTATIEDEIIKLCHYTNLQLLKAKDNIEKSDKMDWNIKNN